MTVRIVSAGARPDLADRVDEATAGAFPEYNTHGDVAAPGWSRLYDDYPGYQLVLWDDATGRSSGGPQLEGTLSAHPDPALCGLDPPRRAAV